MNTLKRAGLYLMSALIVATLCIGAIFLGVVFIIANTILMFRCYTQTIVDAFDDVKRDEEAENEPRNG